MGYERTGYKISIAFDETTGTTDEYESGEGIHSGVSILTSM